MKIVPCDYLPEEYKGIPVYLVSMSSIECRFFVSSTGEYKQRTFIGLNYENEKKEEESISIPTYSMKKYKENDSLTYEEYLEKAAKETIDEALKSQINNESACYVFRHRTHSHICAICVAPIKDRITGFFYTVNVPVKRDRKIYPYKYTMSKV